MSDSVRSLGSQVDATYRAVTGRAVDEETLKYWVSMIEGGQRSLSDVRSYLATTQDAGDGIQAAYQSDFGRGASASEVADRRADLGNGASLSDLHASLAHSAGAADGISGLYQQVLGRPASTSEVADRQADLAGGASLGDLRTSLAQSGEAAGDIGSLFGADMGRAAQAGDLAFWQGHLAADASMAGVRQAFAGSDDAAGQVQGAYQSVLGRAATASELADRRADLAGGAGLGDLRQSLTRTDEAAAGIQALYVQVLGRQAGDGEVSSRQADLAGGQSMAGLRASVAGTGEVASDIQGVFQRVAGRPADPGEVTAWQGVLGAGGWTLAQVGPAVATSEVNRFYQDLFGRDAGAGEQAGFRASLAAGEMLSSQFARLRPVFATSASETGTIQGFYAQTFGIDAGTTDISREVSAIEAALAVGQSLRAIEDSLTPDLARQLKAAYRQDLGREASWPELQFWQDKVQAGLSLPGALAGIAQSQESTTHIQALWQQDFGRYASLNEVQGWQMAEASQVPPGSKFTVTAPGGMVLADTDARTLVAEAGVYVTLAGGLTPTLTAPDGTVLRFRNASEFSAYALGTACRSGQGSAAALQTYDLTHAWLGQVGQAYIQAAADLQARAVADQAAGNVQQAFAEGVGAQLALQVQRMPPDQRHAASWTGALGQYSVSVTVSGDPDDPAGLAGYSASVTDTDPERTALVAKAQAEQAAGEAAGAAGNQLLAVLDNAGARVDAAYAGLPQGARTDRMLGVARQFVDAGQAAAAAGDWNKVQMLETAADVSLKVAAQPEGQRTAVTERYMHKGVKHDVTVDPNTADPFASFKDHSKGQDAVGAIVEGVAGVVINVLAVVPVTAPIAAPLAVAWDTAQAGKNFANGNVLGGFLSLASAAAVGLNGLDAISTGAEQASAAGQGADSFAVSAGNLVNGFAEGTLGTTTAQLGTLGQQIGEGVALVGGAAGIVQSAKSGDVLGIAAGALEVAAAVAGGLVSANQLGGNAALQQIAKGVQTYGNIASAAISSADAFARGDLAGGLSSSLNVLLSQVAQRVVGQSGPAGAGLAPAGAETPSAPAAREDLPTPDGYGYDGTPLPTPPIPPDYVPPTKSSAAADALMTGVDRAQALEANGTSGLGNSAPDTKLPSVPGLLSDAAPVAERSIVLRALAALGLEVAAPVIIVATGAQLLNALNSPTPPVTTSPVPLEGSPGAQGLADWDNHKFYVTVPPQDGGASTTAVYDLVRPLATGPYEVRRQGGALVGTLTFGRFLDPFSLTLTPAASQPVQPAQLAQPTGTDVGLSYNPDDPDQAGLVSSMKAQGKSNGDINAALDNLRGEKAANEPQGPTILPSQQIEGFKNGNILPNAANAQITPGKIINYSLNPENQSGGADKARVFEAALGFNKGNAGELFAQIKAGIATAPAVVGLADQYGQRYTVDMPVVGPKGTATVRTGWIVDQGSTTPRLVTAYVKK